MGRPGFNLYPNTTMKKLALIFAAISRYLIRCLEWYQPGSSGMYGQIPKRPAIKVLLVASLFIASLALAETPSQIAADYRAKANTALDKVNDTLEKATVPIIADLVKAGDTTGADEVKTQLKAKQNGEPVAKPHAKAANLFTLYDAARLRALDPIQQATIRKLDAVLAGADGKKLETVDAVKAVREEVEAVKVITAATQEFPLQWSYHLEPTMRPSGQIEFQPNGLFLLKIAGRQPDEGKWKKSKDGSIKLTLGGETFPMVVTNNQAVMEMSIGKRYLKAITGTP